MVYISPKGYVNDRDVNVFQNGDKLTIFTFFTYQDGKWVQDKSFNKIERAGIVKQKIEKKFDNKEQKLFKDFTNMEIEYTGF